METSDESSLSRRVSDAIHETVGRFAIPGAQVAWCCDGETGQVATGVIGLGRTAPVTADTRFPLASVTKVFTASLALQLVSDGLLSLDGPIGDALPHGRCREVLGDVSLRHLLTHTSGLEDDPVAAEGPCGSPSRYVSACTQEPIFPAGEHFSYSNAGYVVVGHLIEAATGQSWSQDVQAFLLDPLEVRGGFFLSEPSPPGLMADGHVRRPDGEIVSLPPADRPGREWAPTSGLALSAMVLLRLVRMHLDGGRTPLGFPLLDAGLVAEMRTPAVAVPDPAFADAWGLGWALREGCWFGHDGEDLGWTARVRASAGGGFAIAMLASCLPADREWQAVLSALGSLGLDLGKPALPAPPARPEPIDAEVAGRYENGTMRLSVVERDGGFWLVGGDERVPL